MNKLLFAFVIALFCSSNLFAAQAPAHQFVGAKKCSLCHKKPEEGNQYGIWMDSKHAKAYEVLGTQAAKDAAAKLGIADPQTSGKCLKCHSTAYWFGETKVSEDIAVEEGVSCESCHGAGKDYMKKSIMQDQKSSIENGLLIPDEKTCLQCHNSESPTFKEFNYSEQQPKIKHPIPEKK